MVRKTRGRPLQVFAIWPLLIAGMVCLGSGVILGLGTKYGLVRYWWVAIKLAITIAFVILVPLSLRTSVIAAADYGRALTNVGQPTPEAVTNLIFPSIVSPAGLLVAVILAVYKPWGWIRRGSRSKPTR